MSEKASIDLSGAISNLMAKGWSDRAIGTTLQITRHHARQLMEKVKLEQARKEQRGDVQSANVIVVDPEPETVEEFVTAIKQCLQKSVDGFIEAGRHLANARIKHAGEFTRMVERDLGMTPRTAQRLMAIARDDRFATHGSHLPTTWRTLYELTRLDDDEFEQGIESGAIHPGMEREDAIQLKNPAPRSPDGEGRTHLMGSGPAAAAPPLQGTEISNQKSESEVMPSGHEHSLPSDTPPRPAVSEPGGAEESNRMPIEQAAERLRKQYLPNGHRAIAPSRKQPRDSDDFFPTPPWATRTLIERVLPRLGIRHTDSTRISYCWEPACGEGHMAEVLAEYIKQVRATDIVDYGYGIGGVDWFSQDENTAAGTEWIVTNPPFGVKTLPFLVRALELAQNGVAFFTRVQWACEGVNKYEQVYRDRPPTLFAPFMERVNLCEKKWDPDGSTATAYCWLVWVKGKTPKAPFWIPPDCRESLTHPDDAERFTAHPVIRKDHQFPPLNMGHHPEAAESEMMPDIPEFLDRLKEHTGTN